MWDYTEEIIRESLGNDSSPMIGLKDETENVSENIH